MLIRNIYWVVLVLFTFLAGCNTHQTEQPYTQENQTLITSENIGRIADMQWILKKMTIEREVYKLTGERPFIRFSSDGKVSGFASINRYFGSIDINCQGDLKWSKVLGSTRMAGPAELMKQEDLFLNALPITEFLSVEGIHLYAYNKSRDIELVFYVPVK